jgi:hypothetical protein
MHSTGFAVDADGFTSKEQRLKYIEESAAGGANGIGVYNDGSIHSDKRKKPSVWYWGGYITQKEAAAAAARGRARRGQIQKNTNNSAKINEKPFIAPPNHPLMKRPNITKGAELNQRSLKSTVNRSPSPVVQNIVNNNKKTESTGSSQIDSRNPMPALDELFLKMLEKKGI